MPSALIFDLRNTVCKSMFVNPNLSWKGQPTGGIYGFILQLCSAYYDLKPDYVVVCDDHPPYIRKKVAPEYKANRKKDSDDGFFEALSLNIAMVKEFCEVAGFPVWSQKGYEADDMIAVACWRFKKMGIRDIVIRSSDSDLYQLFSKNKELRFYRFAKKAKSGADADQYYTYTHYRNDYPVKAVDLPLYLALTGTHNNLAGVPGIGPKKAAVLMQNRGDLAKVLKEHTTVTRDEQLIRLPYKGARRDLSVERGTYNARKVQTFCTSHGINITGTMSAVLFNLLD